MRLDPDYLRATLAQRAHEVARTPFAVNRRAAVAMIWHPAGFDSRILLIRRAERDGDPWSGHMALPGGHSEPEDAGTLGTAMRETREEVGLELGPEHHLGSMASIQATARGKPTGTLITPHLFAVERPAELVPNQGEVAAVYWVPLLPMIQGDWDAKKELDYGEARINLPAISVDGNLVWGLTHRMLLDFFRLLRGEPPA